MSTEDDDRMDEMLLRAARGYNEPPPTPREAMWTRIDAAREEGRAAARSATGAAPIGEARRRRRIAWLPIGVGIAAAGAIGFAAGRWNGAVMPGGVAVPTAEAPLARAPIAAGPETSAGVAGRAASPEAGAGEGSAAPSAGTGAPDERRGAGRLATRGVVGGADAPLAGETRDARAGAAYRVAALQHLTRTEALLTSFRADVRSGRGVDAQVGMWAGDLLGTTRLLLDSPAADDPRVRALLADLELVLAQLSQLSARTPGRSDTDLIDAAVEERNVLPRLRSTIPAGALPAGS